MRAFCQKTCLAVFLVAVFVAQSAFAGGHTWRVKEIFSNPDRTIQYIETWEALGGNLEIATAGHNITSTTNLFTIPTNVASPTGFRSLLFATQGFADLGVVTPDYIISSRFFSIIADSISYTPLHTLTFTAGQLPTDGINALAADLSVVVNSPENYAGQSGTIDVSPKPPGVPAQGPVPLTVVKSGPVLDGSQLQLNFDTATCTGNSQHQILFGFASDLPATLGGTFSPGGAVCGIGGSPFEWLLVPDPSTDPNRVLWFLLQATNGTDLEGSWGRDAGGAERVGPGLNGSSGQCGITDKDLTNTCGQ